MNSQTSKDQAGTDPVKKKYQSPKLVHYGDVRDLTMGSSQPGTTESGTLRKEEAGF